MDRWSRQFKETVLDSGTQLHMLEKYVDDVNLVLDIIAQGYGWVRDKGKEIFMWTEDRMAKDSQKTCHWRKGPWLESRKWPTGW